uniref:type II toxin-antitoxin system RelE/ParE family toxin n=1 Tax=uncultured Caulobacter sp. TaxID=158749 RepID=UPI0025DF3515|nr:type II toxin-antitoxin system RelE/ParE family toxin [uncultured Caulobacter sp.]
MAGTGVSYSAKARADVVRLSLWIARDGGEARAQDQVDRISATLQRLARRPRLGWQDTKTPGEPRVFSVRPWKIIYQPLSDESGILVLRILDSRQDISALLGKKT